MGASAPRLMRAGIPKAILPGFNAAAVEIAFPHQIYAQRATGRWEVVVMQSNSAKAAIPCIPCAQICIV